MPEPTSPLPCSSPTPVGAADFYFAINATFRFIGSKFGMGGLRQYWGDLGARYFAPVSELWSHGGLPAVEGYWRAFFGAEPGAEVEVRSSLDFVELDVRACPAIGHLRARGREVFPAFCQHCYFVGDAMAAPAGLTVRVEGGGGSCRQRFMRRGPGVPPQDLSAIREVGPC